MEIIINPKKETWSILLERPTQSINDIENTVTQIFKDVEHHGDTAISKYTSIFDGVVLKNNLVTQN